VAVETDTTVLDHLPLPPVLGTWRLDPVVLTRTRLPPNAILSAVGRWEPQPASAAWRSSVGRLLLLVALGFTAASYFPDSRQMLFEAAEPIIIPVVRWTTTEEMTQIGRDVVAYEQNTGQVPDRRGWLQWLDWRYSLDESKQDAWNTVYELKVWADSVGVMSYGPDRTRNTDDDFVVVTPRERGGRRGR